MKLSIAAVALFIAASVHASVISTKCQSASASCSGTSVLTQVDDDCYACVMVSDLAKLPETPVLSYEKRGHKDDNDHDPDHNSHHDSHHDPKPKPMPKPMPMPGPGPQPGPGPEPQPRPQPGPGPQPGPVPRDGNHH